MKIPTRVKNALHGFSTKLWDHIPMDEIIQMLKNSGSIEAIQEDGEPWSGMLVGREGRASIELRDSETGKVLKQQLHIQWYKLTTKFEVNAYIL